VATDLIKLKDVKDIVKEVNDAFYDIPFENSAFQTECFVIAASITPARAYRAIGLRMSSRLRALEEARFNRINSEIDVDEIDAKIDAGNLSEFDLRREKAKREKARADLTYTNKLINDALAELNMLYTHFKALPKYTREQFEAEELKHFTERLQRQDKLTASQQSFVNMTEDVKALLSFEEGVLQVEDMTGENLKFLLARLTNLLGEDKEDICFSN
jgi:hypothetical protein